MFHQPHNTFGNRIYNSYTYKNLSYEKHFHKSFEAWFCRQGKVEATCDNVELTLMPGDFLLVFPYVAHSFNVSEDSRLWVGVFSGDYVPELDKTALTRRPEIKVFRPEKDEMQCIANFLIRNLSPGELKPDSAEELLIKSGLEEREEEGRGGGKGKEKKERERERGGGRGRGGEEKERGREKEGRGKGKGKRGGEREEEEKKEKGKCLDYSNLEDVRRVYKTKGADQTIRIPSYVDRIMWHSLPGCKDLFQVAGYFRLKVLIVGIIRCVKMSCNRITVQSCVNSY